MAKAPTSTNASQFAEVDNIENLFLQTLFRSALSKANIFLRETSTRPPRIVRDFCDEAKITPETPVKFAGACGWQKPRYVHIRPGQPETGAVDRVAAVALQSFYELWRGQNAMTDCKLVQQQLVPFVDIYCSSSKDENSHRLMGIPLAVVLIEFLNATGDFHNATELAGEVLHHFGSFTCSISADRFTVAQKECDDLARLLFVSLLPLALTSSQVEEFLSRFEQPDWIAVGSQLESSRDLQGGSISVIVTFLKEKQDQPSVVPWTSLDHSHKRLLSLQSKVGEKAVLEASPREVMDENSCTSSTIGPLSEKHVNSKLFRLYTRTRHYIEHIVTNGNRVQRTTAALVSLLVIIAWRRRRCLSISARQAIKFILQPIQEIVQAFIPQ